MDGRLHADGRQAEVWARLATVTDPELDESMVDLGFIEEVEIGPDAAVEVAFRLPTYWCSANFAFLMADDIRRAVEELPWVGVVRPSLRDHMMAGEVNAGVRDARSFGEVFGQFGTTGTLDELRETFRRKAFERRQEAVILALRKAGRDPAAICRLTLAAFDAIDLDGMEGADQKPRYRALLVEKGLARHPGDPAFVSYGGRRIEPETFAGYMQRLRGVRINMEFNSVLCRGLLEARYKVFDAASGELTGDGRPCGSGCGPSCQEARGLSIAQG